MKIELELWKQNLQLWHFGQASFIAIKFWSSLVRIVVVVEVVNTHSLNTFVTEPVSKLFVLSTRSLEVRRGQNRNLSSMDMNHHVIITKNGIFLLAPECGGF